MDAVELSRWTRFAAKGGIGKCTAIQDCVAESSEDLMFLKDDEITVLMQIGDAEGVYLGYCEGVVGRFQSKDVYFHSKLKRPVMTKRNSSVPTAKSPTPTSTPPMPSTPVTATAANHAHVPSIAHSLQSVESTYSTQSATTASSAHMDFGLPRVMSPPSMYEQLPNVSAIARVVTVDAENANAAPRGQRKSYLSSLSRQSSLSAPSTYAGDETDREETRRKSAASTVSRVSRVSTTSDGEVGIGLSLLANLGGESTDDDDSDSDAEGNTTYTQPAPAPPQQRTVPTPSPSPSSTSTASTSSSSASSAPLASFPRPPSSHLLGETVIPTSKDPDNPFGTFGRVVGTAAESAAGTGWGVRALVQGLFGGSPAVAAPAPVSTQVQTQAITPTQTPKPEIASTVAHKSTESTTTAESEGSSGSSETEGGGPSTAHGHEQMSSQSSKDEDLSGHGEPRKDQGQTDADASGNGNANDTAFSPPPVSPTSLKSFKSSFRFPVRNEGVGGHETHADSSRASSSHYSDRSSSSSRIYHSPPIQEDFTHESSSSLSIPPVPGPGVPAHNHNPTASTTLTNSSTANTSTSITKLPAPGTGPLPSPFSATFSLGSRSQGSASGEDWEGASDIYDNYFYRYSVASRMSGMSGMSGGSEGRRELEREWERVNANGVVGGGGEKRKEGQGDEKGNGEGKSGEWDEEEEEEEGLASASTVVPTPKLSQPQQNQRPPPRSDSLTMQRASHHHLESMASMASVLEEKRSSRFHSEGGDREEYDDDDEEGVDELFNKLEQLSARPSMGFLEAHAKLFGGDQDRGDDEGERGEREGEEREKVVGTTRALNVVKNSPVSPRFKRSEIGAGGGEQGIPDSLGPSTGAGTGTGTGRRPAPLELVSSNNKRNGGSLSVTGPGPSPLLHTRWGSPASSAGMSTGSVYEDGVGSGSGGYPTPYGIGVGGEGKGLGRFKRRSRGDGEGSEGESGEEGIGIDVVDEDEDDDRPLGIAAGIANALREGVQDEKDKSSQNQNHRKSVVNDRRDGDDDDTLGHKRGIVIEDDEELPSHAVDPNESELVNMSLTTIASESKDVSIFKGEISDDDADSDISHSRSSKTTSRGSRMELAPLVITNDSTSSNATSVSGLQVTSSSTPTSHATSPYSAVSPYSPGDLPLDLLPPPSPSTFPPAVSPQQPSPPIPRPSLAELRGYDGASSGSTLRPGATGQAGDSGQRRSLFLPHPNAPKAPVEGPGPMYIRSVDNNNALQSSQQQQQTGQQPQRRGPDPKKVAANVLRMVLSTPPPAQVSPQNMLPLPSSMPIRGAGSNKRNPPPPPPAPLPRGPTIYARVDVDLGSAMGPVPITFSVEPMGPPPLPTPITMQQNPPAPLAQRAMTSPPMERTQSPGGGGEVKRSVTAPAGTSNTASPSSSMAATGRSTEDAKIASTSTGSGGGGGAIPRPNFFPQVGARRPRSRSFSDFNTSSSVPVSSTKEVADKPALRTRGSSASLSSSPLRDDVSPVKSPPKPGPSPLRPPSLEKIPSLGKLRGPSPLSLPHNNTKLPMSGLVGGGIKPPVSPLAVSFSGPPSPTANSRPSQLRKVTSATSLRGSLNSLGGRTSTSRAIGDLGASDAPPLSPVRSPVLAKKQSIDGNGIHTHSRQSTTERVGSAGVDSDTVSVVSSRSQAVVSPPPMDRQSSLSLRSKLSLPNMRRSNTRQGSMGSGMVPIENETVQVEDMDFELIKPSFAQLGASSRSSEDSGLLPLSEAKPDLSSLHLRAESPAISISSGVSGASRGGASGGFTSDMSSSAAFRSKASSKSSDAEANMDAHRQREQKWMALMSSVPASQARKSKKVRKLVGEGVPSSVRYLVWSHLTDSKSKNVAGVYAQLSKRAKVAAFGEVERDVMRCFGENPHLQTTMGPLLCLLQAYLTMVPDVQYSTGLTLIAGHLLLLAPEEDAFWIFVSMMDSVLRPYFSPSSTQMEVDAALFSRALEANDAQVSKKVLIDMSINPAHICFPWFTSLFVSSLPTDYINRVWDLYLYEGVPFLIRVGLAIFYCCRRAILEATSEEAVLQYLKHPSATWLPPSSEAFITLASSFKVKDDDVRKQRVKMEAQVKRQAQTPRLASGAGAISLPRS